MDSLRLTLVVGMMGVGKSTLLSHLPDGLDFDEGPLLLSGVEDDDVDYDEWRSETLTHFIDTANADPSTRTTLVGFVWPDEIDCSLVPHTLAIFLDADVDTINARRASRGEDDVDAEFVDDYRSAWKHANALILDTCDLSPSAVAAAVIAAAHDSPAHDSPAHDSPACMCGGTVNSQQP